MIFFKEIPDTIASKETFILKVLVYNGEWAINHCAFRSFILEEVHSFSLLKKCAFKFPVNIRKSCTPDRFSLETYYPKNAKYTDFNV